MPSINRQRQRPKPSQYFQHESNAFAAKSCTAAMNSASVLTEGVSGVLQIPSSVLSFAYTLFAASITATMFCSQMESPNVFTLSATSRIAWPTRHETSTVFCLTEPQYTPMVPGGQTTTKFPSVLVTALQKHSASFWTLTLRHSVCDGCCFVLKHASAVFRKSWAKQRQRFTLSTSGLHSEHMTSSPCNY